MTLGEKLKQIRLNKGLRQEDVADGITEMFGSTFRPSQLSKYETDNDVPTIETLSKIAKYYGTSMDILLDIKPDGLSIRAGEDIIRSIENRPRLYKLWNTSKDMTEEDIDMLISFADRLKSNHLPPPKAR